MKGDRGVVIIVEGDTEVAFFKSVVARLMRTSKPSKGHLKIVYKNAKGIGNFQKKIARIFERGVLRQYPGVSFDVVLCYDTDAFEYAPRPPVDWPLVELDLKKAGAQKVHHVKARKAIEDWFMDDYTGVCAFLRIPPNTKVPSGDGLFRIQLLFKKANKVYVKGRQLNGFIEQLNIEKIINIRSKELKPLYTALKIKGNKS